MGGLEGIILASMAQDDASVRPPSPMMERISALRKPRLGALVKVVHDEFVHPTFNVGQEQISRPQAFPSFGFGSASATPIGSSM